MQSSAAYKDNYDDRSPLLDSIDAVVYAWSKPVLNTIEDNKKSLNARRAIPLTVNRANGGKKKMQIYENLPLSTRAKPFASDQANLTNAFKNSPYLETPRPKPHRLKKEDIPKSPTEVVIDAKLPDVASSDNTSML